MNSKLPPASTLAQLIKTRSYGAVAADYGATRQAVHLALQKSGYLPPAETHNPEQYEQQKINALTLIRQGVNTYRGIATHLGYASVSSSYFFIEKLLDEGLVIKSPDKAKTLQLTPAGEREAPLIIIAQPNPHGTPDHPLSLDKVRSEHEQRMVELVNAPRNPNGATSTGGPQ